MKKRYLPLLAVLILCCGAVPTAAVPPIAEETAVEQDAVMPDVFTSFQGGDLNKFRHWVTSRLVYPDEALMLGIEGVVIVQFVINEKGQVRNIKVLVSPDPSLSQAVLLVMRDSPRWTPALKDGEPIPMRHTMPVEFRMIP